MESRELAFLPAVELMQLLEQGEVSSRDLLDCYLERIRLHNPNLNAVVTLDAEGARARAEAADKARAGGVSWGPLHGLPVTVKDVFETEGLRTTAGSTELSDYVPDRDAVLVKRLKDAGAVIFGKTNTPTLAADGVTANPVFGRTNNPWNLDLTPGGSSGGCAAAVASGLTSISFGSDVAGSIRVPSAYTGLFGHKPTYGLIPSRGHIPPLPVGTLRENDTNVVGPLARDPRDLDLTLAVLAGPLSQEALGWKMDLPPPRIGSLRDYRVAAWLDDPFCPVDASVKEPMQGAIEGLRQAGVTVTEAKPDLSLADSHALYLKLMNPGSPIGTSTDQLTRMEWLALDEERHRLRERWASFFEGFDVLICPVGPVMAQPHYGDIPMRDRTITVNGEELPWVKVLPWTCLVGLPYLPATAVPIGLTKDGSPVGFQVIGAHLNDRTTIDFAKRLSVELGGFEKPPGF